MDITQNYPLRFLNESEERYVDNLRTIRTLTDEWIEKREHWDPAEPATILQIGFLWDLGAHNPESLSKSNASILIDHLLLYRKLEQFRSCAPDEQEYELRKSERRRRTHEAKAERQRHREIKKRADQIAKWLSKEPRKRLSSTTRINWMLEFEGIWNNTLSDNSISIAEAEYLKAWLIGHRTTELFHEDFIIAIDRAAQDGVITGEESQNLYQCAIKLIESLGGSANS